VRLTLLAPFAGTVADLPVEVGEVVNAAVPVVTLADFDRWLVETTDLTELDVVAIAIGYPATVEVDGLPGGSLNGTVVDIAPVAQEVRGDMTYTVQIELDEAEALPLRWGMTVFVTMATEDGAVGPGTTRVGSEQGVSAEGVLEPIRSIDLSFLSGGTVAELLVQNGQQIASGEALIRLDARPLENGLAQAQAGVVAAQARLSAAEAQLAVAQSGQAGAEAAVSAAEARLALLRAGARAEEVAAAESEVAAAAAGISEATGNRDASLGVSDARVRAAEARVAAAEAELVSLQETYDTIITTCFELPDGGEMCPLLGPPEENVRFQLETAQTRLSAAQTALGEARNGATAGQRQAAEAAVAVAIARRDIAQARLALLLAGAMPQQIEEAQVMVEQARLGLSQVEAAVQQAEAQVAQAAATVVSAQAAVAAAEKALERMTLHAPFAGTVANITVEVGELVAPGGPVATVADLTRWQVRTTDLVELDIASVVVGQEVEVTLDAIAGEVLPGRVERISRVAEVVRGDVTYSVIVTLDEGADLPLRWGMTALVNTK
jgi:multidrug resistance efflux pump